MKAPLALAGAVLIGASLAACGSDSGAGSDYCKDLKSASSTFDDVESGNVADLDKTFTKFHQLADQAPEDVQADWKVLDGAITTVEKGLEDAGIKFSDFAKIQAGELPEGVDATKLQGLATTFSSLGDEKFTKAGNAIEKHAKDVCKVEL